MPEMSFPIGPATQAEIYLGSADAVLLGRPYVYGLAVAGQAGVERVIRNLTAEIDLTLALIGGRDIKSLDRSWISPRP